MKLALLAPLVLASSVASSVAFAQAPGDYYGGGYGDPALAPPGMVPEAPLPPPPPPPPLRRFSIGVGVGHVGLAPHNAPDMQTDFGVGELAARYLLGRHLEVELLFAGGDAQANKAGAQSNVSLSEAVLDLRWRFSPQCRWNWWLLAGMGSLTVAPSDASSDQRKALAQSTLQFGVGLERRWTRFALQAELRAVGVKQNDTTTDTQMTTPGNPGMKGGQFALSANYYF